MVTIRMVDLNQAQGPWIVLGPADPYRPNGL